MEDNYLGYSWGWSEYEYDTCEYDTIEECIQAARKANNANKREYVLVSETYLYCVEIDAESFVEDIVTDVHFELGDIVENWADDMSDTAKKYGEELEGELNNVLIKWIKKHNLIPDFRIIKNTKKYELRGDTNV